jgi:serine O-acetyltransferase
MSAFPGYLLSSNFPSRQTVISFTEELINYLFPLVADPKAFAQQQANAQATLYKKFIEILTPLSQKYEIDVLDIEEQYFEELQYIKQELIEDAELILEFDPAAYSIEEVILSYPGFYAIIVYRLTHALYKRKMSILPRMMSELAHSRTGIDINPGATIGCPFFIDHGTGIVIGETTVIGKNVKIYQGVTLGALAVRKEDAQTKRHPSIEDNVVIYANSTILGGNTIIGHDSIVGGNTWITQSVMPHSVVYTKSETVVTDKKDFTEPLNFII